MTVNPTTVDHGAHSALADAALRMRTALTGFTLKALAKAGAAFKTLQTARMMSVLSQMTDEQLSQIGITRAEIPSYVQMLMDAE